MTERIKWQFLGFESVKDGQPVQVWFNGLPEDAKDEIRDLLVYLGKMTASRWRTPEFDPLHGAGGISELRLADVSIDNDGVVRTATYRIYGFFGPRGHEHSYTFLHGVQKIVRNDKNGKRIAKERLNQIELGHATVHQFEF